MIVAITGNRNLTPDDAEIVDSALRKLVADAEITEIRFGGARGADTIALAAALDARGAQKWPLLVVILPGKLGDQPLATRSVTQKADVVTELGLAITRADHFQAYRTRNWHLVVGDMPAGRLVAFWDGDPDTGTAGTMAIAHARKTPVEEIPVEGSDR